MLYQYRAEATSEKSNSCLILKLEDRAWVSTGETMGKKKKIL